jgi:hypothetical protein
MSLMTTTQQNPRIYFASLKEEGSLSEPGRKVLLLKIEEDRETFQLKTVEAWSLRSGRKEGSLRVSRPLANPSRFNANLAFGFSNDRKQAIEVLRRYY